jgi:exodeoxyribonuclease VII small subunit
MPKEKYEDALNKLEKIVSQLEKGDISLEESLKLFEEGIRLSRLCNQKLDEAEKRVEILLKGADGTFKAQPFISSVNSGQAPSAGSGQAPSIDSGQAPSIDSDETILDEDDH